MKKNTAIALVAGIVVLILLGLGGWYVFLRLQQSEITSLGERRGFGSEEPTFTGFLGSTFEHITGGLDTTQVSTSSEVGGDSQQSPATPRLWRISSAPAAGVDLFGDSPTTTRVAFVDRATGHVFSANTFSGLIERITNTLMPATYRSQWLSEEKVVLSHFNDQDGTRSFIGTITSSTSTEDGLSTLTGTYLENNILTTAVNKDLAEIFYMIHGGEGVLGIVVDEDGGSPQRVFNSIIRNWRPEYLSDGTVILTQNAASGIDGNSYIVTSGEDMIPLFENKPGLTVQPHPISDYVLYGTSRGGELRLFAVDRSTTQQEDHSEVEIPLRTVAEKCVWDPSEDSIAYCAVPENFTSTGYPDTWYRGEVHSSDRWWKIDAQTGAVELLIAPESEYGVVLDVLDPKINEQGTHITFLDARTLTPWVFMIHP